MPHNIDTASAAAATPDLEVFGDPDAFKLLCKASSVVEGSMKSTKAMMVSGVGCIVQVSTRKHNGVAEALVFVPGVEVEDIVDDKGVITGRKLVKAF